MFGNLTIFHTCLTRDSRKQVVHNNFVAVIVPKGVSVKCGPDGGG